ncbi:MAG: hypothetical protein R3A43_01740 [Bacteroidia bacterium]
MKKIFLLVLFVLPSRSSARFGDTFSHLSIFIGQQYAQQQSNLTSFDFLYESHRGGCIWTWYQYWGLGGGYYFNPNTKHFRLKFILNPYRTGHYVNRQIRFYYHGNVQIGTMQ